MLVIIECSNPWELHTFLMLHQVSLEAPHADESFGAPSDLFCFSLAEWQVSQHSSLEQLHIQLMDYESEDIASYFQQGFDCSHPRFFPHRRDSALTSRFSFVSR